MADTHEFSFANNFWGKDDAGVENLLGRMHHAKQTCEEIHGFWKERIAIEEDYAKRMMALSRRGLGSNETGTLRQALDTVRQTTEAMGRSHSSSAQQIRKEVNDPLEAFSASTRQRRKTTEALVDKLQKAKAAQNNTVEKARTKFEMDCNKLNGYYAQQNLLMGKDLEKNNMKLEKVHMTIDGSRKEYQNSLRVLAETIDRWNKDWKESCDKFQDLEEERISFLKSNLWAYANIVSTVCVSDDEGCESIRVSLEKCDVHADIQAFVEAKGTGSEILDPPEFVNFLQGYSRDSTTNGFKVAQFKRDAEASGRTSSALSRPMSSMSSDGESEFNLVDDPPTSSAAAVAKAFKKGIMPTIHMPGHFDSDRSTQPSPIHDTISPNSSVYSNPTSLSSQSDLEAVAPVEEPAPKKRTWASPFRKRSKKKDLSKGWNSRSQSAASAHTDDDDKNDYDMPTITAKSGIGRQFVDSDAASAGSSLGHRASVLGMGENMFDLGVSSSPNLSGGRKVESPEPRSSSPGKKPLSRDDPLLAALERLKVSSGSPLPQSEPSLVPPQPAFTSTDMEAASGQYTSQTMQLFEIDSPQPTREVQRPRSSVDLRGEQRYGAHSPVPGQMRQQPQAARGRPKSQYIENSAPLYDIDDQQRAKSNSPVKQQMDYRQPQQHRGGDDMYNRAKSPAPYQEEEYTASSRYRTAPRQQRPMSHYEYGNQQQQQPAHDQMYQQQPQMLHARSKSSVDMRAMRQQQPQGNVSMSRSGRKVLRHSRAAYDYRAAIPEEVSFRKGDVLLVLRMQEDGWWEVEVSSSGRTGLAPSNFLVNA